MKTPNPAPALRFLHRFPCPLPSYQAIDILQHVPVCCFRFLFFLCPLASWDASAPWLNNAAVVTTHRNRKPFPSCIVAYSVHMKEKKKKSVLHQIYGNNCHWNLVMHSVTWPLPLYSKQQTRVMYRNSRGKTVETSVTDRGTNYTLGLAECNLSLYVT